MAEKKDGIVREKFTHKGVTFTLTQEKRSKPVSLKELQSIAIDLFDRIGVDGVKKIYEMRDTLSYYPWEVIELCQKVSPEIEKLWASVERKYKKYEKSTKDERTPPEILQDSCLAWIDKNETKVLKREFFESEYIYPSEEIEGQSIKRDTIGKLHKVIISHYLPHILSSPKEEPKYYGFKRLYKLYKAILKFINRDLIS